MVTDDEGRVKVAGEVEEGGLVGHEAEGGDWVLGLEGDGAAHGGGAAGHDAQHRRPLQPQAHRHRRARLPTHAPRHPHRQSQLQPISSPLLLSSKWEGRGKGGTSAVTRRKPELISPPSLPPRVRNVPVPCSRFAIAKVALSASWKGSTWLTTAIFDFSAPLAWRRLI